MERQISEGLKQRIAIKAKAEEKKAIKGLPEKEEPFSRIVHDPTKAITVRQGAESHGGKIRY
jgi:hypothetical protein